MPFYLYGWQIAKILLFPCAFLIFCIPPSLLDSLTVPLRIMTSVVSEHILNGLGIPTIRQGTLIISSTPGGFRLGVDDPCSGLRSLIAIAALTAVYAHFMDASLWKKFVLFFSALPLAIIGNVVRVITVAIVAGILGQDRAMGFYHDYSGYVVFAVAVLLTMGVGKGLERFPVERLLAWIRIHKSARSS
jgi:exosortase